MNRFKLFLISAMCLAGYSNAEATPVKFEPYIVSDHAPVLLKASKKATLRDRMTLGDIVKELGPGWMTTGESAGIITWSFDDHSELLVDPSSYVEGGLVTFRKTGVEAAQGKMWFKKDDLAGTIAPIILDAQRNNSEVISSSAILHFIIVSVDFSPWTPEPGATGLSTREARMHLRLADVLKGRVKQKSGETFDLQVPQRGTAGARVMDFYGFWSQAPLSAGTSFVAFCQGESDDARVLLKEENLQGLLLADEAYSDTKAAVELENKRPTPEEVLSAATSGNSRYGGIFARFVWEYVRTDAIQNVSAFGAVMRIVESPETTTAARNTYLMRAHEELGLHGRPLRGQEIRLARAIFRLYDLPGETDLKKNMAEVYLPNLLGLAMSQTKYSSVEIFPDSPTERRHAATLVSQASQDARAKAVVQWLNH